MITFVIEKVYDQRQHGLVDDRVGLVGEGLDGLRIGAQILDQVCAGHHLGPLVVTEEAFAILDKVFIAQMLNISIHCEISNASQNTELSV